MQKIAFIWGNFWLQAWVHRNFTSTSSLTKVVSTACGTLVSGTIWNGPTVAKMRYCYQWIVLVKISRTTLRHRKIGFMQRKFAVSSKFDVKMK